MIDTISYGYMYMTRRDEIFGDLLARLLLSVYVCHRLVRFQWQDRDGQDLRACGRVEVGQIGAGQGVRHGRVQCNIRA